MRISFSACAAACFIFGVMSMSLANAQGPDGGILLSDDSFTPSAMFDAKGQFQFFVPGVPVGPREPDRTLTMGFIDSGTTSRHPQLDGLVLEEKTFVDGPVSDELGHGTWAMLVTFTAQPDARFGFYSAKVTRDGADLRAANVMAAFKWLVSKDVRVINISLGFERLTPDVQRLCKAIESEPSVFVAAAAGNFGPDVKIYPAHCGAPNVLAVGESKEGKAVESSGRGQVYAQPPKFLSRWAFLNERGRDEARSGRLDAAASLYRQSVDIQENPEALHELALIAVKAGDWTGARARAARAVDLAPDESELHQTFGAIVLHLGETDRAIAEFERSLELNPKNQNALLNMARAKIAKGDRLAASLALDRARANDAADQRVEQLRSMLSGDRRGQP
jgi:hypothetical protein